MKGFETRIDELEALVDKERDDEVLVKVIDT